MILYHGSDKLFKGPDLSQCKEGKDFGKGFYLTSDYVQAVRWATRKKDGHGYVYTYEVRQSILTDSQTYKIKALTKYDKEWLDFIVNCRYKKQDNDFELIYDKMADSTSAEISDALELYYLGKRSVFEVLAMIRDRNIKHCQYCFKTETIIKKELHKRGDIPKEVFK